MLTAILLAIVFVPVFFVVILRVFRVRPRRAADRSHPQPPGGPAAKGAAMPLQTPAP
jgi:heme/copper-type cytochrome/quinol oxidase subunit 2